MILENVVVTPEVVNARLFYARIEDPRLKEIFKRSIEEYRSFEIALADYHRAKSQFERARCIDAIWEAARGKPRHFLDAALESFERNEDLEEALRAGAQTLIVLPRRGKTARKKAARAKRAG